MTLRTLSGDPFPTVPPIGKIQRAIDERLPPFNGLCVACDAEATTEVPILFSELRERSIADDGGFRLGLTGLHAVVGKAEDVIETTEIPILLCDQCAAEFESQRPSKATGWAWQLIGLAAVGAVFEFFFQFWQITLVAVALFALRMWRWRRSALAIELRRPKWVAPWITRVRWFPEAIRDAMEYSLNVGEPRSLQRGG